MNHSEPKFEKNHSVKVLIQLSGDDRHDAKVETVWAERLEDGEFSLRNVPFYSYSLSFGDCFKCKENDGMLILDEITHRSGHSTYRVFLNEKITEDEFITEWKKFSTLKCSYERATQRLIAIDIPFDVNINDVYGLLEKGESRGLWSFEEAHVRPKK